MTEDEFRKAVASNTQRPSPCVVTYSPCWKTQSASGALSAILRPRPRHALLSGIQGYAERCVLAESALAEVPRRSPGDCSSLGCGPCTEAWCLGLRAERTNAFLAQLWHEWPDSLRAQIPDPSATNGADTRARLLGRRMASRNEFGSKQCSRTHKPSSYTSKTMTGFTTSHTATDNASRDLRDR